MIRSLRNRLLVGGLATTLVVFGAAGAGLYALLRGALIGEFDATLDAQAMALASMVERSRDGFHFDADANPFATADHDARPDYFLITDASGNPIAASPSLRTRPWPMNPAAAGSARPAHAFVEMPGDRRGRTVRFTFTPRSEDDAPATPSATATIAVARDATALRHRLNHLAWIVAGVFAAAIALSGAGAALVVHRGLRPLGTLADRIRDLGAADLSERVELRGAPSEMIPIVTRLNVLLGDLESTLARERAFTADVAHELRTPLAGLLATLQVTRSRRREPAEYQTALQRCQTIAEAMIGMVETLLLLARADAHQLAPQTTRLDLAVAAGAAWANHAPDADARDIDARLDLPANATVRTDPKLLDLLLRNLMDNAVTYCDPGGRITLVVTTADDGARFSIANTGSAIDAADVPRVTDRFWRFDAARGAAGHHGLGLALCRRLADVLAIAMTIRSERGGQFVVELAFARDE